MKDVKIHDFEKLKKYNPSQLKFLTLYSEAFSKSSNLQLQYELKNKNSMKMVLKDSYQEPYSEFLEKMDYETVLIDFNVGDNVNNLIFNLDKKASLILIDCLVGGNGKVNENKELTEIDIEILKYISNTLFKKAGDFIDMSNAYVNEIYTNKAQYRNSSAKGYAFVSIIDVYLNNEIVGNVKICVPYVSIENVIEFLMAEKTDKEVSKNDKDVINSQMIDSMFEHHVKLDVVGELGSLEISVRELLNLEKGDVFMLDKKVDQEIEVLVGGHKSYLGKPGRIGTNNAIVIMDSLEGDVIKNDKRENE